MATSVAELETRATFKDDASKKVQGLGLSFGKMAAAVGLGTLAANAFQKATAFATETIKGSIKQAQDAQVAQTKLATILRVSRGATDEQIKSLIDQADALEKVGVVADDVTIAMQSQLASFDLQADSIRSLTPALLDYIVQERGLNATMEDAQGVANGFAQALQGNFASLTKSGFVLDEATKKLLSQGTETEKVTALTKVLNSTYEGLNEKMRETSEGGAKGLQFAYEDLQKAIGLRLLPVMDQFRDRMGILLTKVTEFVQSERFQAWLDNVSRFMRDRVQPALAAIGTFFTTVLVPVIMEHVVPAWQEAYAVLQPYIPVLKEIVKWLAIVAGGAIVGGIIILSATVLGLAKAFDAVVKSIKAVFDWIEKVSNKAADFFTGSVNKIADFVLPGRASGGPVSAGHAYVVGENGAEVFVPRQSGTIMPNGSGATININVTGNTISNRNDIDTLVARIQEKMSRDLQLAGLGV